MNEQINLLQNSGGRSYAQLITKLRLMRFIAVFALFIVAAFSIMLFLIIAFSPLPRLQQEEERLIATLNTGEYREKMDKYYYINSRLTDIDNLLRNRPEIITSYELVERIITPTMSIKFLDISESATTFTLASPNLAEMESAVTKLTQDAKADSKITSLTLSSIAYNAKENVYEMSVTITQTPKIIPK
jgi:cytoskeletal protein RodZ